MAANLKGRLARLRSLGPAKPAASLASSGGIAPEARPRERPDFLGDWEKLGDLVWTRTLRYDLDFPSSLDSAIFAPLRRGNRGIAPQQERIGAERLRFFDLETTGLSGGTGTIAFLAAVGRFDGEGFALSQLFLEDFPGERLFIEALLGLFGDGAVLVSYNGRAFDAPLLRTRCVMNGVIPPSPAHLDALYASRRLWRRIHGGASLGLLEREVLGVVRGEDLPGAMIPEVWLDFARRGENPLMHIVLSHNADDVVGLARLVSRLQGMFDDPLRQLARSDVDRSGLGRALLAIGRQAEGEELLEASLGDGDEASGLLLSRRYRVAGRAEDAVRIAEMLPRSYKSAIERAKLHERLAHDLRAAALWAEEAAGLAANEADRDAAQHRLRRLGRRIAKDAS